MPQWRRKLNSDIPAFPVFPVFLIPSKPEESFWKKICAKVQPLNQILQEVQAPLYQRPQGPLHIRHPLQELLGQKGRKSLQELGQQKVRICNDTQPQQSFRVRQTGGRVLQDRPASTAETDVPQEPSGPERNRPSRGIQTRRKRARCSSQDDH